MNKNYGELMMKKRVLVSLFTMFIMLLPMVVGIVANKEEVKCGQENFIRFENKVIEMTSEDSAYFSALSNNSTLTESEEVESENGKFALKRLIVSGRILSTYGATAHAEYDDLHILSYATERETESAYIKFSKDEKVKVFADSITKIDGYAESDYDYASYINWGAKAMDIGGYTDYLNQNNVNKEAVVVVLDTGINTSHRIFDGRLLTDGDGKVKGYSYHDSTYKYSYSKLAFDEDDTNKFSFEDARGHGTHVAGIICGLTPQNVKILPIKISEGSSGTSSSATMIAAYLRVINVYSEMYNIVCTNLSFSGGGKKSEEERDIFNEKCYQPLLDKNIVPITAAGNESKENSIEGLKAVVVSALKESNGEYEFDRGYSNFGSFVDISAPGTDIVSAKVATTDMQCSTAVVKESGTSMASPQVASVVALLCLDPKLNSYTAEEIIDKLYSNAVDLGRQGKDKYYGHGMVNLKYFETTKTSASLSITVNGNNIDNSKTVINYESSIQLGITCTDSAYEIIYTINGGYPTYLAHTKYTGAIARTDSFKLYAMGVKIEEGKIVEKTSLYGVYFFNTNTPVEDYFVISDWGQVTEYTGNFEEIVLPEKINNITVEELGPGLFEYAILKRLTLPATVTSIGGYVFKNCYDLEYVYGSNVTKIYVQAFESCTSIDKVVNEHPSGVNPTGVYLPMLEETIGVSFAKCTGLETVSLPKLTKVGNNFGQDFAFCSKLSSVYLPNITIIPNETFYECTSLTGEFLITDKIKYIGTAAFYNSGITSFKVSSDSEYFYTEGSSLYSNTAFICSIRGSEYIDFTILSSVEIKGVTTTITEIYEKACFENYLFNTLTIPTTITKIGRFAFANNKIKTLTFNAANMGYDGYYDKETNFIGAAFNDTEIDNLIISSSVVKVPERLFQNSNFHCLTIKSIETKYSSSCFFMTDKNCYITKLVLDFSDVISITSDLFKYIIKDGDSVDYISGLMSYNNFRIEHVYYKRQFSFYNYFNFNHLMFCTQEGEYYVYSSADSVRRYEITATTNEHGSITYEGKTQVVSGDSITYYFTPNTECIVKSIIIDGTELTGADFEKAVKQGYTFPAVGSDHTISVVFEKLYYYDVKIVGNEFVQKVGVTTTKNAVFGKFGDRVLKGTTIYFYAKLPVSNTRFKYSLSSYEEKLDETTYLILTYVVNADKKVEVNAIREVIRYTITWLNYDGSELLVQNYWYNDTPVYSGDTPARQNDEEYSYTFSGWTPGIVVVKGNETYTATFIATSLPSPPPEIPEEPENPDTPENPEQPENPTPPDGPENPVEPNPTPPTQQQPSSPNEEKEAEPINYKVLLLVAGGGGVVIGGTTITISIIRKKKRKKMSGWR